MRARDRVVWIQQVALVGLLRSSNSCVVSNYGLLIVLVVRTISFSGKHGTFHGMNRQDLAKLKIPAQPGVYLFKKGRKILYIGKATSLRTRTRSYFDPRLFLTRGPVIEKMVAEADALEWTVCDSVLEALILEAKLIKKFQPEGNAIQKDDKSFLYVTITKDVFPHLLVERGKGTYGPFTSPTSLREALRIIRRIFPYNTHPPEKTITWSPGDQVAWIHAGESLDALLPKQDPEARRPRGLKRGCFEYQIGLCPGACVGVLDPQEYRKTVEKIRLLFEGNKARLLSSLRREMLEASKRQEFEKAALIKRQLSALKHIRDTSLIKDERGRVASRESRGIPYRIEAYDIAHMAGSSTVGVMTVVEDGQASKRWYRKFNIKLTVPGTVNDIEHLRQVLRRRLVHLEWPLPQLIVVDGGLPQKHAPEALLQEKGFAIDVAAVLKDEKHKPKEVLGKKPLVLKYGKEILLANSEAHRFAIGFHRKSLRKKLLV